jgi:DNA-binding transcriptional LysR family regulator
MITVFPYRAKRMEDICFITLSDAQRGDAVELQDLDLNLLVVLNQLLAERSVSKAARTLGISQPAISNSLAKLRKILGDPLFLRTGKGMEPTPYADQLAEPVSYALGMIHSSLNQHTSFHPAESKRVFTIGMTDIGEIYFLPTLMRRLRHEAPSVAVSTMRNTSVNLQDDLQSGKVDLAIGLLPQLKAGFFQRRLFTQSYVCLMRRAHPLNRRQLSIEEYQSAQHLRVIAAETGHGRIDELLQRSGVERKFPLTVPHYVCVGHILQGSDMIATVPEKLADKLLEPFQLAKLPLPAKLPDVAITVFWHAKYHRAPANQWLRTVLFELFGDSESPTLHSGKSARAAR